MAQPKALILRTAGTNCDIESAFAAEKAGFAADRVHINRLASGEVTLDGYDFVFVPGGFSYGDDVAAGKIMAQEINNRLGDAFRAFEEKGRLALGVCNGFQVLIKTGLIPFGTSSPAEMRATLTDNDSGTFEDRWVHLGIEPGTVCVFTRGLKPVIELPVAHGEGKFIVTSREDMQQLEKNGQIVMRYVSPEMDEPSYPENPNGSMAHVAGVCNEKGTFFGLMPHPERFTHRTNHPRWTRTPLPEEGDGMGIFKNAYQYCTQF